VSQIGSGRWDAGTYSTRAARPEVKLAGTSFLHTNTARKTGVYNLHATVDPKVVAGPTSAFVGSIMRESRDSDEHPETTPIAVFFDVTGSMHTLPEVLQKKLPALYSLLLTKGYVEHPQILFGAIGDAKADRVPLQVGQFESDNRADESLENLLLEGGGGGGNHESYELAAYFMARHTSTDAWDKRGKKGYLFLIGDERIYSLVQSAEVKSLIGDGLQESMTTKDLFEELQMKWEVYFLFARQGTYQEAQVLAGSASDSQALGWRELLRQNALVLDDADAVCETIGLTIGLNEGVVVDLDSGLADLADVGSDSTAIAVAGRALAGVGAGLGASAAASASGDLDVDGDGAERL
jgi:hypothetical protein